MPGQGLIVATGALDYPAEYRSMAPRTLSLLGISKVMTMTSTYDHRIIQGAESGLFLARIEELLRGEDGFYERDLRGPEGAAPPGALGDRRQRPASSAPAGQQRGGREAGAASCSSSTPTACAATWSPTSIRSTPRARRTRTSIPRTYGLTMWDLDREFITNGLSGKDRADAARDPRGPARHLLRRRSASSTCTSPTPSARSGCRTAWSRRATARRSTPPAGGASWRSWSRPRASSGSCTRSTSATSASRSRAARRSSRSSTACSTTRRSAGVRGGRHRHGPPRPPQRARQHGRQAAGPDLLGVRRQRGPRTPPRARAT